MADRAEGLTAKNRKRGPHEVLDHVEGRPEQILVDDRLARPRLGTDERSVLEREERGLDRISAGLETADRLRDPLRASWIQGVDRRRRDHEGERRERRRDVRAEGAQRPVRPEAEDDDEGEYDQEASGPRRQRRACLADDLMEAIQSRDAAEGARADSCYHDQKTASA